jgi:hypothetical protein
VPDDRLVYLKHHPSGLITFEYRPGFMHPDLMQDLNEISRHMMRSPLLAPRNDGEYRPDLELFADTRDPERLPLSTLTVYARWSGPKLNLGILVRADMMGPELVREFNDEPMAYCMRVLHPTVAPRRA